MIKKQQLYKALFAACMLLGSSAVFAQVKIGTNPTTIDPANNLEVESSTAGNKVSVNKTTGKVTIADGSQGNDKILTSNAAGVATWQAASDLKIQRTVFTGYFTGSSTLTTPLPGNITRIPFTTANPSSDYDVSTRQYTIPSAGMYRVEFNAQLNNLSAGKVYWNEWVNLISSGSVLKVASFIVNGGSGGWGPALFLTGVFAAGDKVEIQIASYDPTPTLIADPMTFSNGSLIVTKLD
ncbi:hypothetical protein L0657_13735 [Dyadobacter sp. CY345]|uniref:hypothetical protein n=1 Tax=Dyadobacter sp. CY345 TaxID=2909335 RepID=UPI001F2B304F|nr:hypothetical protein [Dyadobacter sp. CY345]MCF2445023.1 hypothetical protein [Dyadobacter sp. CY345]